MKVKKLPLEKILLKKPSLIKVKSIHLVLQIETFFKLAIKALKKAMNKVQVQNNYSNTMSDMLRLVLIINFYQFHILCFY